MKWFKPGMSKGELSSEYKKLARKWHPDLNPGNSEAEANMKEIDDEYDRYFVLSRYTEIGYNAEDINNIYQEARKHREIILVFLRRDKVSGKGFFSFNRYGKITTDDAKIWDEFHGGFALCQLTQTVDPNGGYYTGYIWKTYHEGYKDQVVTKLPAEIGFANYAEMYFGLNFGQFESESTALVNTSASGHRAIMLSYVKYRHIKAKNYGDIWLSDESFTVGGIFFGKQITRQYAYMKVGNQIMRCGFDLKPEFFTTIETVNGHDFGYLAFQECTQEEFFKYHDVDYTPTLAPALECELIRNPRDLYWIDDPVVAHFARTGLLNFYQSKRRFKMRYGTFNQFVLEKSLHELSIDDAEHIQDYLDDLNKEFDQVSKGMVKKGKLTIDTSARSNRFYF